MADVEIYTGYLCGYCFAAKRLLRRKGAPYRGNQRQPATWPAR